MKDNTISWKGGTRLGLKPFNVKGSSESWTPAAAGELYDVVRWGKGYFAVGARGQLLVHPTKQANRSIDLKELVDKLVLRGISPPILIRFGDILKHRLEEIHRAFQQAIDEHSYQGRFCCVYPIKVNQQRQVVEEVFRFGRPYGFGLEAGSKAELLAVLAVADNETPIICNGFKDEEYIEMVVLARKIGRDIIPVVEKFTELELITKLARRNGVRPSIGIRMKLASRGAGRWTESGGPRSKFGLTAGESVRAVEQLKAAGMADCIELLHFHLGSQISDVRQIKAAVTEAAQIYVELVRAGAGLKFLDVGGGLGIDYDGSQTDSESSANYTLQEYANDVVYHIQNACDQANVAHPTILTESGRAVVAYHSVLVFNVLGVSGLGEEQSPKRVSGEAPQPLVDLQVTYDSLRIDNLLESFHDAQQAFDQAHHLFSLGYLSLQQRALAENLYWAVCRNVARLSTELDYIPEDLQGLDAMLSDTYFCNFSVFQSVPDSWAIKQLFPVMPIHRLDEPPTRHAVLGDISCDSDGKIDRFIDRRNVKRTLRLHPFDQSPYYLGAFLVGAYQEILGDLHNLLGDTNAVHVRIDDNDQVILETVVKGDTVQEVLNYVQFSAEDLLADFRRDVETALRAGRIGYEESGRLLRFYEEGLSGYTYLE
jgi:arginine decarboxylase